MRILLDENVPVALFRLLVRIGREAEHLALGAQRGSSDTVVRERLRREELLFLTRDIEFLLPPRGSISTILVSRVPQSMPLSERLEVWDKGIDDFFERRPAGLVFELVVPGVVRSVRTG